MKGDHERELEAVMNDYITKSIDVDELGKVPGKYTLKNERQETTPV